MTDLEGSVRRGPRRAATSATPWVRCSTWTPRSRPAVRAGEDSPDLDNASATFRSLIVRLGERAAAGSGGPARAGARAAGRGAAGAARRGPGEPRLGDGGPHPRPAGRGGHRGPGRGRRPDRGHRFAALIGRAGLRIRGPSERATSLGSPSGSTIACATRSLAGRHGPCVRRRSPCRPGRWTDDPVIGETVVPTGGARGPSAPARRHPGRVRSLVAAPRVDLAAGHVHDRAAAPAPARGCLGPLELRAEARAADGDLAKPRLRPGLGRRPVTRRPPSARPRRSSARASGQPRAGSPSPIASRLPYRGQALDAWRHGTGSGLLRPAALRARNGPPPAGGRAGVTAALRCRVAGRTISRRTCRRRAGARSSRPSVRSPRRPRRPSGSGCRHRPAHC